MSKLMVGSWSVALVLAMAPQTPAQEEVRAIVEKAIKAHGGAEKLDSGKASVTKSKGTLEIMGMSLGYTQQIQVQPPAKFKEAMDLDINGMKIAVITAYDGTSGWLSANGMVQDLPENILAEVKEAVYGIGAARFTNLLKDKKYVLSPLGEAKVNDRPAAGIKVASEGHRDINMYFDKATGLLAKAESRKMDFMSNQEVNEERIVTDYQVIDGLKIAKKVLVNRDGKKFIEAEITDIKFVDKIEDSEFQKP
jgi:hypothetical protein